MTFRMHGYNSDSRIQNEINQLLEGKNAKLEEAKLQFTHEYEERLLLIKALYDKKAHDLQNEHKALRDNAYKEFEDKKLALKSNLQKQLEEERKNAIHECQNIELNQEINEVKPAYTRRMLRRRMPNDLPCNGADTKRKKQSLPDIKFSLDEKCIDEDLAMVNTMKKDYAITLKTDQIKVVSNIVDGKLYYDKRYYYRGQAVYISGPHSNATKPAMMSPPSDNSNSEENSYAAIIQSIEHNKVCLRKLIDNNRIYVTLAHLQSGTYHLRKRIINH